MTSNLQTIVRGLGDRRSLGRAVVAIGLAHFIFPRTFDPINRLGFPDRARTFTYINGAIETVIGAIMVVPGTRRQSDVLSACYVIYLASNIIRAQADRAAVTVVRFERAD